MLCTFFNKFFSQKSTSASTYCSLLCLFGVFPFFLNAQIEASEVIQKALDTDRILAVHRSQLDELSNFDAGIRLIESIELRTEYDNFKEPRSEYTSRIKTNGIKEQDAQRKLNKGRLTEVQMELLTHQHQRLCDTYQDLVEWAEVQEEKILLERQKLVLEDRLGILQKKVSYESNGDFGALFKTEAAIEKLNLDLAEKELEIHQFEQKYAYESEDLRLNTAQWLPPDELLLRMQIDENEKPQHPVLQQDLAQKRRIELRQDLEDAKQKKRINFFQLRYRNRNDEGLGSNLSVGFGFALPYNGSSKVKAFELKIDALEEERKYLENKAELDGKLKAIKAEAALLSLRYTTLKTQASTSRNAKTIEKLQAAPTTNPLVLLDIKTLELEQNERLQEVVADIRRLYVEWLEFSGLASSTTSSSWLEP